MKHEVFHFKTLDQLKQELHSMGLSIPLSDDTSILNESIKIGNKTMANRLSIQPMEGCDGTSDGKLDTLSTRRYERFAKSGAGLIWFEAVAIVNEGRANPRQLFINDNTLDSFKSAAAMIKETCLKENGFEPILIMQATHSGRYSKPTGIPAPIIAYNNPNFEKDKPLDESCIIKDDELKRLESKYGEAASLAQAAGFDGVDIKCCHGYLNSELLSAFTRKGEYGGKFENRTRLLTNGIKAAQANVSSDFIVTSRLNVYDGYGYPYGFGVGENSGLIPDMTEPLELVRILHNTLNINLLDITIGNPYANPHVNRPYDMGAYIPDEHPLEGVSRMYECVGTIQKQFPDLNIISSGPSYLRQFSANLAAGAVKEGNCKIVGFGREAFAYPTFAKDILNTGVLSPEKCCITCGKCTELMRAGSTAGCVIRDSDVYAPIYKQAVINKK